MVDEGPTIPAYQHLAVLADERDLRYQQRFDAQTTAINAAMAAAEKAVTKAEVAAERRFELLNELRQGVATRQEVEALEKLILALQTEVSERRGKGLGLKDGWGYIVGAIGIIGVLFAVLLN